MRALGAKNHFTFGFLQAPLGARRQASLTKTPAARLKLDFFRTDLSGFCSDAVRENSRLTGLSRTSPPNFFQLPNRPFWPNRCRKLTIRIHRHAAMRPSTGLCRSSVRVGEFERPAALRRRQDVERAELRSAHAIQRISVSAEGLSE